MYFVGNKRRKQRILIRALARAGYAQIEIVRIVGVAQSTVNYWLSSREQRSAARRASWLESHERKRRIQRRNKKVRNKLYRSRPQYKQQRIAYDVAYNIKRAAAEYAAGDDTPTNMNA
jgi:DNA-binding transcriptional regulator YdaS (Cro superfamily)